ncbi:UDP-N-acetylmuramoyl-tripeptide--D-alanyl-D-alanine ligase [Flavobacterium sp. K77]|uniref:UDP-N-acetylmuramoyl-tripeptide--D-alanyl-D- alanine ligase n=1 Tax=Flavobacterium sp. K77 TaxID=2910676 RepID=UPI001F2E3CC5|nr:UDP-N-acetylmuramoyl-tripeptide--D-alanyl-D-alanine ligase [Flavobacterium sp. K77]MCF6142206.1 UDP-N-acetylmuramoyl-tripeptide--D-alanyl-D-alanine ligase [Flavobacterium sp. K77]
MDINHLHQLFLECSSISIDTRKIEPKSLFVAIKGERFDANTFAEEALLKGASFVIIDNPNYLIDHRTILVPDSLVALQELAKFHRQYLNIPIVALTGSNGKTTTKELINVVLSKKFKTKATVGNLNNHIGVPLTLLSFNKTTEIGIVEMGANHQKEIEFLCEITQPDFGYITNFGKAHLEGFGGVEGVIKGKSEMYDYLKKATKLAFVNLEDEIQIEKTNSIERYTFGVNKKEADINISAIEAKPLVKINYNNVEIQSQLIGLYNANNINAAIAIGTYFKVALSDIKVALENYIPENNRSQLMQIGSNKIILDAYNANPSSMKVAIANFIQLQDKNKILVLGDMFELGEESKQEHKLIVESVQNEANIICYFVGADFKAQQIVQSNLFFYESFDDFAKDVATISFNNNSILIKGSRGMALERTTAFIK